MKIFLDQAAYQKITAHQKTLLLSLASEEQGGLGIGSRLRAVMLRNAADLGFTSGDEVERLRAYLQDASTAEFLKSLIETKTPHFLFDHDEVGAAWTEEELRLLGQIKLFFPDTVSTEDGAIGGVRARHYLPPMRSPQWHAPALSTHWVVDRASVPGLDVASIVRCDHAGLQLDEERCKEFIRSRWRVDLAAMNAEAVARDEQAIVCVPREDGLDAGLEKEEQRRLNELPSVVLAELLNEHVFTNIVAVVLVTKQMGYEEKPVVTRFDDKPTCLVRRPEREFQGLARGQHPIHQTFPFSPDAARCLSKTEVRPNQAVVYLHIPATRVSFPGNDRRPPSWITLGNTVEEHFARISTINAELAAGLERRRVVVARGPRSGEDRSIWPARLLASSFFPKRPLLEADVVCVNAEARIVPQTLMTELVADIRRYSEDDGEVLDWFSFFESMQKRLQRTIQTVDDLVALLGNDQLTESGYDVKRALLVCMPRKHLEKLLRQARPGQLHAHSMILFEAYYTRRFGNGFEGDRAVLRGGCFALSRRSKSGDFAALVGNWGLAYATVKQGLLGAINLATRGRGREMPQLANLSVYAPRRRRVSEESVQSAEGAFATN